MKIYVFDLDHTLCDTRKNSDGFWEYTGATPFLQRIEMVNALYAEGHMIIIDTARGCDSGHDWYDMTYKQLISWGLKFTRLRTGIKLASDFYIDDKAINSEVFFNG